MSLLIDPNAVTAVLLTNGWHEVGQRDGVSTFNLDAYEFGYIQDDGEITILHGGGRSGVCAAGFQFETAGEYVSGPLTAIFAVRHKRSGERREPLTLQHKEQIDWIGGRRFADKRDH